MSYHNIFAAELGELLQRDNLTVIDMRDAQAQAQGQLPNAQPASDAVINNLMRQRRSDPPVLVYCYHGNSSRDLCSLLTQLGLTHVYNLEGGWEAWQNSQRTKPPQMALQQRHHNWLQSHGFDANDFNSRVELGMTALMLAALKGDHELLNALLAAGADPKAINDDEHHALWFACVHGDIGLVKKFIAAGCDINNRNVNGVTCAIYAASTGKLEVLQTLIESGADLGITTHDGVNALDSASTLPVLRFLKPLMRQAG